MKECVNCGKEHDRRGKYCSDSCKQAAYRNTQTVTKQTVTRPESVTVPKIQDTPEFSIPNFGQPDCECMHCRQNRRQGNHHIINHGPYKPASALSQKELNRVSLPGDVDYVGVGG